MKSTALKLLEILRDPIWQAIGVLATIIATFVATAQPLSKKSELIVFRYQQNNVSAPWLSSEGIKIFVQGMEPALENTVVDYFLLKNDSTNPIKPTDYIVPIEVRPSSVAKRILSVASCSKPYSQACTKDGNSTPDGGTYVPTIWQNKGDHWEAEPLLLNKGDQACVLVVSELITTTAPSPPSVEWNARITNVQLKSYPDRKAYENRPGKEWDSSKSIIVIFVGAGVYWFMLLFSVLFLVNISLGARSGWIDITSRYGLIKSLFLVLLSVSISEILVDVFINKRTFTGDIPLHPIIWPLILAQVIFTGFLTYQAIKSKKS